MYKQITMEDLGLIPKTVDRKQYVSPCGGCICQHCINNVDCNDRLEKQEALKADACFNCDDCYNYSGKGTDNWKTECQRYVITNLYAMRLRKHFQVLQAESEE